MRDEAFAERLFEYLRPALSTIARVEDGVTPCGLNPDFRFYRYLKGTYVRTYVRCSRSSVLGVG